MSATGAGCATRTKNIWCKREMRWNFCSTINATTYTAATYNVATRPGKPCKTAALRPGQPIIVWLSTSV
jgi:hypothetical protein